MLCTELFGHALLMVAEEDDELCHSCTDDEVTEMIDKRDGVTKKPIPSQETYFPRTKSELPGKDVQPSQKKALKAPFDD